MAVFASPGLYIREIEVNALPSAVGPIRPAFIGTAKKGPMNTPVFCSGPAQAVDTFGEPDPKHYLMYGVLSFFEEGDQCYIVRVGIELEDGQDQPLADVAIDTSGARTSGWGRIPVFTGIDYGKINLRYISAAASGGIGGPITFGPSSIDNIEFSDANSSTTYGETDATLDFGASEYTGDISDSFTLVITGAPTQSEGANIAGATYEVRRSSDNSVVASGTLTEPTVDYSNIIDAGDGLEFRINTVSGVLDVNDTFAWSVTPDNRDFAVSVEGGAATTYTMPTATYTTTAAFVTAVNNLLSGEDYQLINFTDSDDNVIPQIRTTTAGDRIQVTGGQAWCNTVGISLYAYDIPRSHLIGVADGPYTITNSNNRVLIDVIGASETQSVTFSVAVASDVSASTIATSIHNAGIVGGDRLWHSFALTTPGGESHVVIVTDADHELSMLRILANYSNLKTLRFAQELDIQYPYSKAYRGFGDNRTVLPASSTADAAVPASCDDPESADCASDTAYYENIVGWFVASSAGTWIDGYKLSLTQFTEGLGDSSGRYKVELKDNRGVTVESIDDVTFDKNSSKYIENAINPGTTGGGFNGNVWFHWEARPSYLQNDPDSSDYTVRLPSQLFGVEFTGMADGVPLDPAYSSDLDTAVIGNPAKGTGLYAFQNPESIDVNIITAPGFSGGAVIGQALQICESRGDAVYLVDPPFGLRPQQVVDWHNGMLLSSLNSAIDSSYGGLYWSWGNRKDTFNKINIWVPPSGHVAAVFSRSARIGELWSAAAGSRRGRILTMNELEYAPSLGERDLLYGSGNAVNPIAKFPNRGIMVYGDRTLKRGGSIFDHMHVRMLMIAIKKSIKGVLTDYLFEPNDRFLWDQIKNTIDPLLGDIQARRGLDGYRVICDDSNNTKERRAQNQVWVSVLLVPTGIAETIVVNMVALRQTQTFTAEEVLSASGVSS